MNSAKWKIVHASVIGTAHIERQTECQDRHSFRILEATDETDEVLIAALSDGAGSSQYSQIGAELACTLFIQEISKHFETGEKLETLTRDFGILWLEYYRQQIGECAAEMAQPLREFACTFLGVVATGSGAVFYQVGDGAIVCSTAENPDVYFFGVIPEKKIYANATDFITDEKAEKKLLYDYLPEPLMDLAIFTDGIQAVAVNYQTELPHEPFLKPMLAPLRRAQRATDELLNENLANFLNSPRINDKTDDDKTLFLASRAEAIEIPADSASELILSQDQTTASSSETISDRLPVSAHIINEPKAEKSETESAGGEKVVSEVRDNSQSTETKPLPITIQRRSLE